MKSLRTTFARVLGTASISTIVLGLFLALQPIAPAQNLVYAVTNTAGFGTLDLDSGTYTQLGTSQAQLAGLGELGANLYSVVLNGYTFEQVSLADGSLTPLASVTQSYKSFGATTNALFAVSASGNLCYYLADGSYFGGGCFIPVVFGTGTLAMSADGDLLYAAFDPGTGSILYLLNTTNGTATVIGPTSAPNITSLIFRHGTLYAVAANKEIYTVNTQTGQATSTNQQTSVAVVGMAVPASTFTVLHTFTGHDGATPEAGLIADRAGNLYGITDAGGTSAGTGNGTVFKLTKHGQDWTFGSLYSFQGGGDGANPQAPLAIGPDGAFYGTTNYGGNGNNDGTLFKVMPPAAFCRSVNCGWGKTTIYVFPNGSGCSSPEYGGLIFDGAGNMYGTTQGGGPYGQGCVFEETRSGNNWTFSEIYGFRGQAGDGAQPYGGVIFDNLGNLYGTTANGGSDGNLGTIYELSPLGGGWMETILHNFAGYPSDGEYPQATLLFDGVDSYYGTAPGGGTNGGGAVYKLTNSGGTWNYSLVYSFPTHGGGYSSSPVGGLVMDAAGNLYGAANDGGAGGNGNVYELTPSNGGWIYTELYDFTAQTDGDHPFGNLLFDSSGNLYGTASCSASCPQGVAGTVYKLTPQ